MILRVRISLTEQDEEGDLEMGGKDNSDRNIFFKKNDEWNEWNNNNKKHCSFKAMTWKRIVYTETESHQKVTFAKLGKAI